MTKTLLISAAILTLGAQVALAQQAPGEHFMENWDLDENGVVSLAEAIDRRGDIFTTFDDDENGALEGAEYDAFDEARAADRENNERPGQGKGPGKGQGMGQGQGKGQGNGRGQGMGNGRGMGPGPAESPLARAEGGMSRQFNDTDGDGAVTREEFLGNTQAWLQRMDRNGDGQLTVDDFGRGHR